MCWEQGRGIVKENCMDIYKEERRNVKRCIYQNTKEKNDQLRRKMNQDVSRNIYLFRKELSTTKGRKMKNYSKIKDRI